MPRPNKCRTVISTPEVVSFKPMGNLKRELEEIQLTIDEFEAIRLADYEGMYQEKAATQMNISRQTFGNIINAAHKKIADFLVNGKALQITGGAVEIGANTLFVPCRNCKHRFKFGTDTSFKCPKYSDAELRSKESPFPDCSINQDNFENNSYDNKDIALSI